MTDLSMPGATALGLSLKPRRGDPDIALCWAAERGRLSEVAQLLADGANVHADDNYPLRWAAIYGHAAIVRLLRAHGARLEGRVANGLHVYSQNVQAMLFAAGDVSALSVIDLAGQGVSPEALCILLDRQGQSELTAMIAATKLLHPLTPQARAVLLGELFAKSA